MIVSSTRAAHLEVETPPEMRGRPVDHRGFPVPWFVTQKDAEGRWDFANIDAARFDEARRKQVCWVSGTRLGRHRSFVVGPMCVVTGIAGDPPARRHIARWSAQVCPFISRPLAKRSLDEDDPAWKDQRGAAVPRNPGVMAIVTTEGPRRTKQDVWRMMPYLHVEWWARGRLATRAEVMASVESGLPVLERSAKDEGVAAERALRRYLDAAERWWPSG